MRGRRHLSLLSCIFTAALASTDARADPPSSYEIECGIHETPSDPESPLTFRVRLLLARAAVDGTSIGWEVSTVEIARVSSSGSTESIWTDESPRVDTPDTLWWVDHADENAPQAAEFAQPPFVSGTAASGNPEGQDLDYELGGETYTAPAPPETPPYAITGMLSYYFILAGGEDPLSHGEDEPVEVDPPTGA